MAEALDIARETYLAFLMDRTCMGPVIVGSPMGGMDIEEVAKKHPDAIHKVCTVESCFDTIDWTFVGALCRVGQKNRTCLNVDNSAVVSGRKTCDTSKVSECCKE